MLEIRPQFSKTKVTFSASSTPDKTTPQEDNKMKTKTKILLGTTALASLAIGGIIYKRSLNKNAIQKIAEELGINDVKIYQKLKENFRNVKKIDKDLTMDEILSQIDEIAAKGILKNGDTLTVIPQKVVEKIIKEPLPFKCTGLLFRAEDKKTIRRLELILHKDEKFLEDVKDFTNESNVEYREKLYIIPINLE